MFMLGPLVSNKVWLYYIILVTLQTVKVFILCEGSFKTTP